MAARSAQMLIEDDENGDKQDVRGAPPTTLSSSTVEVQPSQQEPDYEIVDEPLPEKPEPGQQQTAATDQPEETDQQDQERSFVKRPKREQRQRRLDARDRSIAEIDYLRGQVEQLNGRLSTYEPRFDEIASARVQEQIASVDREIQEQATRAVQARRRMSDAMMSSDGDAFAAALEERDEAIIKSQQLAVRKNVLSSGNPLGRENVDAARQAQPRQQTQEQPRQEAPRLSPTAARLAQQFAEEHDWVDMTRGADGRVRDVDSRRLAMIDNDVAADGYDPSTQEYWDELADRASHIIGKHTAPAPQARNGNGATHQPAAAAVPTQRRGPMTAGSADRPPPAGRNQVYLSAARKMAMIEAGALESDGRTVSDKNKFGRLLTRYQEFDRANGVARQ